jgi:hypothetical protein
MTTKPVYPADPELLAALEAVRTGSPYHGAPLEGPVLVRARRRQYLTLATMDGLVDASGSWQGQPLRLTEEGKKVLWKQKDHARATGGVPKCLTCGWHHTPGNCMVALALESEKVS